MVSRFFPRVALASVVASLSLVACAAPDGAGEEGGAAGAQSGSGAGSLRLCAGLRGNGELILTHFASLSRLVEQYGVIDGMAGGSSGSITTFAYESILMHGAMGTCGGKRCSEDDKAARVALALKSVQGYADVVAGSPEAVAVQGLADVVGRIKAGYEAKGIEALAPDQAAEAAARLRDVLSVPELRDLVNPEVFALLGDQEHLAFNVAELKTSISQLGAFKVDDNRLFFRAAVLNWPALANLFGRVGDFYAGYGPSDRPGMGAWLDACAAPTRGLPWAEAANVPFSGGASGGTCGEAFGKLLTAFRGKVRSGASYASRIDDQVGAPGSPLRKLVTTAVLGGGAKTAYEQALASYVTGAYVTGSVPFAPPFDDVKFGYWGSASDLATLASNPKALEDLKTQKMTALGDASWRTILAASPAEPGLSRFVKLPDGRWSAGGWSDLAPTLALENLGCENVVYVTREGDESKFAVAIAKHAGMSEAAWRDLYDLSNPASSYARSVASADAVWCTKWNDFGVTTMPAAVLDAYAAPLETRAGFADVKPLRSYANATPRVSRVGCTPGLAGDASYPR
jgi:hypothetical protein